jgi:hypothetical protein
VGVGLTYVLGYYPAVYAFAGAQRSSYLSSAQPLLIMLVSFLAAATVTQYSGSGRSGLLTTLLGQGLIAVLISGLGKYIAASAFILFSVLLISSISAILGTLATARIPSIFANSRRRVVLMMLLVLLVLTSTYATAITGLSVQAGTPTNQEAFSDAPVYVGGFMAGQVVAAKGVSVTVDFSQTNPNVIQSDNFLAAGIGVQSPNCCVDGLDYGYRIDAYLFNDGKDTPSVIPAGR